MFRNELISFVVRPLRISTGSLPNRCRDIVDPTTEQRREPIERIELLFPLEECVLHLTVVARIGGHGDWVMIARDGECIMRGDATRRPEVELVPRRTTRSRWPVRARRYFIEGIAMTGIKG